MLNTFETLFSGNTPTKLEIWGQKWLNNAEILPVFSSSGNSVTSQPASSESLQMQIGLLSSNNLSGTNLNSYEFEVEPNELLVYKN